MRRCFSFLFLVFIYINAFTQNVSVNLNNGWSFQKKDSSSNALGTKNKWYKAEVPGTVHTDLLANKLIPDPFYRDNEAKVQWIEKETWDYKKTFDVADDIFNKKNIEIEFDGLDTYAEVYLNSQLIISANNMFRKWVTDIKPFLKKKENVLYVRFLPTANIAKSRKQNEKITYPDNERIYVRKAQYQFGWDWGPRLVTAGIRKEVRINGWDHFQVRNIKYKSIVSEEGSIELEIVSDKDRNIGMIASDSKGGITIYPPLSALSQNDSTLIIEKTFAVKKGKNKISITVSHRKIKDWNPENPVFYRCTAGFYLIDEINKKTFKPQDIVKLPISRKNINLVTQKDSIGEAFYFEIDGKPTFIKGTNWIPTDNFLPRAKKLKHYENLIKAAKDAGINMIRVWGGGVYEDDAFYELCDKYGIMVWQDFMFAGAMYPGDENFLTNVEEEIRHQVKRLRNHPSIVLWCGNNEIDEAWHNWGWQKQFNYSVKDSAKIWNDYKKIFHQIIPTVLNELDPGRPYWSSSPSIGWGRDSAYKKGDVHYWGVWWGKEPVEKYNEKIGRFNSEYGMQGMPNIKSINQFTIPADRDTSSTVMRVHQKHPFGYENLKLYINNKFRAPQTFENIVYVSQLMQADAIKTAIEAHLRNMPVTMGTMFWQWNDCWPVVSWSAIDYYGRKKAIYYEVKRSFKDLVVLPWTEGTFFNAKVISERSYEPCQVIVAEVLDFNGNELGVTIPAFNINMQSLNELEFHIDTSKLTYKEEALDKTKSFIKFVLLCDDKKETVGTYLFLPPKDLNLLKADIKWKIINNSIELTSDTFAYGVYLNVPDGVELEDNYFHLLPKEKKIIKFSTSIPVKNIKEKLKIKSLVDTY